MNWDYIKEHWSDEGFGIEIFSKYGVNFSTMAKMEIVGVFDVDMVVGIKSDIAFAKKHEITVSPEYVYKYLKNKFGGVENTVSENAESEEGTIESPGRTAALKRLLSAIKNYITSTKLKIATVVRIGKVGGEHIKEIQNLTVLHENDLENYKNEIRNINNLNEVIKEENNFYQALYNKVKNEYRENLENVNIYIEKLSADIANDEETIRNLESYCLKKHQEINTKIEKIKTEKDYILNSLKKIKTSITEVKNSLDQSYANVVKIANSVVINEEKEINNTESVKNITAGFLNMNVEKLKIDKD